MTPGISGLRWEMHHLQDVAGLLLGPPAHNTGPPFVQPWDCLELLGHGSGMGTGCPFACLPTGMLAGLLLLCCRRGKRVPPCSPLPGRAGAKGKAPGAGRSTAMLRGAGSRAAG